MATLPAQPKADAHVKAVFDDIRAARRTKLQVPVDAAFEAAAQAGR